MSSSKKRIIFILLTIGIVCVATGFLVGCATDAPIVGVVLNEPKMIDPGDIVMYDERAKNEIERSLPQMLEKAYFTEPGQEKDGWLVKSIKPLKDAGRYFGGTYHSVAKDVGGDKLAESSWLVVLDFSNSKSMRMKEKQNMMIVKTKKGWKPWLMAEVPSDIPLSFLFNSRDNTLTVTAFDLLTNNIDRAYEAFWNLSDGSVSFEKEPIKISEHRDSLRWEHGKTSETTMAPTIAGTPEAVAKVHKLGDSESYVELAAYDEDVGNGNVAGRLLFGRIDAERKVWSKVEGEMTSLAEDYYPAVVRVGNRIYLDGKEGNKIKMIDLSSVLNSDKGKLILTDYDSATPLITEARKALAEQEPAPIGLGSYFNNILLIMIGGGEKRWIIAMQHGQLIGRVFADLKEKKLTTYGGSEKTKIVSIPVKAVDVELPQH